MVRLLMEVISEFTQFFTLSVLPLIVIYGIFRKKRIAKNRLPSFLVVSYFIGIALLKALLSIGAGKFEYTSISALTIGLFLSFTLYFILGIKALRGTTSSVNKTHEIRDAENFNSRQNNILDQKMKYEALFHQGYLNEEEYKEKLSALTKAAD